MKTAVEWLADQLKKQGFLYDLDIEAAKEKEKEQIIEAYKSSINTILLLPSGIKSQKGNAEEYYNKTYNQNK